MPNFFTLLKHGHTKGQIKSRNKRFQKRKVQIEEALGGAAVQREYNSLDEMLEALINNGEPHVANPALITSYLLDWRRKERHGGVQSWYALCDLGNVVHTVVWTMTDYVNGVKTEGGKLYDMTKTAFEEMEELLNLD
jgi:hypothetical protein